MYGFEFLLKYYNLLDGDWKKFNYVGEKDFDIGINDLDLVEVNYLTKSLIK